MTTRVHERLGMLLGVAACGIGAIAGAVTACSPTPQHKTREVTTFYVVRHAEKVDQSDNAALSAAGHARAEALRQRLDGIPLAAIYATSYRRTQQTVQPTATAHDLTVTTTKVSAAELLRRHRGQAVLIAGHSNTVPQLLRDLGVETPVTIEPRDYGDLFRITVPVTATNGAADLRRSRFGGP